LGITRQLYFSGKNKKSLDVVLSVNGIPVVMLELKNPLSGQTAANAIHQYRHDRDPREPIFLFTKHTLVHFAVDTEAAHMTTRLAGTSTHFLPFNKGWDGGAGNEPDKQGRNYKTAYLWEEVLSCDSLLDLLARFLHLDIDEKVSEGVGHNYLVEHSAGSGKSNTMRQAIEEGFIEDVLKSYVSYKTYYKRIKKAEDDPYVERKKAARALARFMRLHPHNIGQKTEVMVEHFQQHTRHKIGGHAKAMVVTGSRLEAVRYKQEFDRYISEKGYPIKSLVAFSGTVEDDKVPEKTYTEVEMNHGLKEKELPETFAKPDYRVLLVAEKYQTGFDQPLLHTMYVDKRLAGIQAVQTLSRLNRTHPLKDDTFVLDFVMGEKFDPDRLYEVKAELDGSSIYLQDEVDEFSRIFFAPKRRQSPADHKSMNALLDQAVARFAQLQNDEEDEAELWRGKTQAFRNLYSFLSQVIPYQDSDLEKLFTYLRHLALKLPKRKTGPGYQFDEEVELDYYRLQKISEGSINLAEGYAKPLDGPREVGTGEVREAYVTLSRLIDLINEHFGAELSEADQLFFDQIAEAASQNESLRKAAEVNSLDKFQLVFRQVLESLFIERIELNEELFTDYMSKLELHDVVSNWLGSQVYDRLGGLKDSIVYPKT
jgi:type I restriction enzyme R subunit